MSEFLQAEAIDSVHNPVCNRPDFLIQITWVLVLIPAWIPENDSTVQTILINPFPLSAHLRGWNRARTSNSRLNKGNQRCVTHWGDGVIARRRYRSFRCELGQCYRYYGTQLADLPTNPEREGLKLATLSACSIWLLRLLSLRNP